MLAPVALLLLADLLTHRGGVGRPIECNSLPGERGANVWERAKIPELSRYCDVLASGAAKLSPGSRMAPEALTLADQAERLVPGRAATALLRGRALAQLARYPEALTALRQAKERDDRALDDPTALLAWARALAFTGDSAGAHEAFRALLPRTSALPLADRAVAYLAAAMLVMSTGPSGLDETIAILRQGRHDSQDLLRSASSLTLALAIDRSGDSREALAVLAEEGIATPNAVLESTRVLDAMGRNATVEAGAIGALVLEAAGKRDAARAAWLAYVAAVPGGVWEAHARAHLTGRPSASGRHP
jgi:tetratricopeptide (TPR) repeat protein